MLNINETWSVKEDELICLERNNGKIVIQIFSGRPEDRTFALKLRNSLYLNSLRGGLQKKKFSHHLVIKKK